MKRPILVCLCVASCRHPQAAYAPLEPACSDARVGAVTVEGGVRDDVPQLAVLEGTLDNPERTARVAHVSAQLLRSRGYPRAEVTVSRRAGCGVELVVAVAKGPRSRTGSAAVESDDRFRAALRAAALDERDLLAGQLDLYADARLQRYVQGIADRLARAAKLARAPRVVIGDHDGTYAAFGERIVIGRMAIERLASEAELAAIVAHELVHVEGRHTAVSLFAPDDDAWLAARRDAEAIADERAVALLERAGYMPTAMTRALAASLEVDDDEHPPREQRLASVRALAAGRNQGVEGRAEYLRAVDRMIVGPNTRLGMRVDDAWVIGVLGIAIELRARDIVHPDGDALVLRSGAARFTAYPIGAAWARELAGGLVDAATATSALGPVTVGIVPDRARAGATPLARLEHAIRDLLPQPAPRTWIVVLERPRGGLVVEISAGTDAFTRDRWLAALRAASRTELAAVEPPHVVLHHATHAAKIAELVTMCPAPEAAVDLDDPDRRLSPGEPFKCTNR